MKPDITVVNHGSVVLFRPMNDIGREWLDSSVSAESWQWFGGALVVDPRYAFDLVDIAQEDGLEVEYAL